MNSSGAKDRTVQIQVRRYSLFICAFGHNKNRVKESKHRYNPSTRTSTKASKIIKTPFNTQYAYTYFKSNFTDCYVVF